MLQAGQIDLSMMLKAGSFPFGDKLLQLIQSRQEQIAAQQQGEGQNVASDNISTEAPTAG